MNSQFTKTALLLVLFVLSGAVLSAQERLVLLDGTSVEGTISRIDSQGTISGDGLPERVNVDGLRRVETSLAAAKLDSKMTAELLGGGILGLARFSIDGAQDVHLANDSVGELKVPIDAIRWVRFTNEKPAISFREATLEKSEEDRVFVKLGGGLEPIDGLIEEIDDANVVIDAGDGLRKIARDKVYGIVFAMVSRPPDHSGEALVSFSDGSAMWGKIQSLKDGSLSLKIAGGVTVDFPWDKVSGLKVRSTRMVFLSDLEPLEARHQPLVTLQRPWQRDRSVGGRPLSLAGRQFEKGIGVASRSVLIFQNESKFNLFAATIGIDEETQGRGDCVFVVEVDGREKFRQRVVGKDPPRAVRVELDGGTRIALIVETGEDLDLSDHADWCDARFVKE